MRELSQGEKSELEQLIDHCGLASLLNSIASICDEKASHIQATYADRSTAREWQRAAKSVTTAAESAAVASVSS